MLDPPMANLILDQYACRPTGSTTAALIDLPKISPICYGITNAWSCLQWTLLKRSIVLNTTLWWRRCCFWIFQTTYLIGWCSISSVVAMPPRWAILYPEWPRSTPRSFKVPSFVIVASGLHPKHHFNLMTKCAEDTYLMVGSRNIGTVIEEFANIQVWALRNNLIIHPNKTKEMKNPGHDEDDVLWFGVTIVEVKRRCGVQVAD